LYVKTGLNNPQTIHLKYFDNKWYVLVFGRLFIFCSHAAIKSIPLLGQGALINIIIINTFICTALTLHYNVLVRHKHLRAPIKFDNCDMQNVQVIFFISFELLFEEDSFKMVFYKLSIIIIRITVSFSISLS